MEDVARSLEAIHDSILRGDLQGAIGSASHITFDRLPREALEDLLAAVWASTATLGEDPEQELRAYDLVLAIGRAMAAGGGGNEDGPRELISDRVYTALFNKGVVLAQLGRTDEAIACYDQLVAEAKGSRKASLQQSAVRALFNKGTRLTSLARLEEAIEVYDSLIHDYADTGAPGLLLAVGKALINKGIALAELDRSAEAVAVLDEVATRWSAAPDPQLRERAARALLNKAAALMQLGQRDLASETYADIIARFEGESDSAVRELVEIARFRKQALEESAH